MVCFLGTGTLSKESRDVEKETGGSNLAAPVLPLGTSRFFRQSRPQTPTVDAAVMLPGQSYKATMSRENATGVTVLK